MKSPSRSPLLKSPLYPRPAPFQCKMTSSNARATLLETILSQQPTRIQTSSPERPSDNTSSQHASHPSIVQSATLDINTPSPTSGLESGEQGANTKEIETWEVAEEHLCHANNPSTPDSETSTDSSGDGKGDDGDYKDLRQRLAVAK